MTPPQVLQTVSFLSDSIATDTFQVRAFDDSERAVAYMREPSATWVRSERPLGAVGFGTIRSLRFNGVTRSQVGADHGDGECDGDEGEGGGVECFEPEHGS